MADIFVTEDELQALKSFLDVGKVEEARNFCSELAVKHGLPAIPDSDYGITRDGKLLVPQRPRPISSSIAFSEAMRSPVVKWIRGGL